ncbi:signal peptide peptidase SppA [Enterobacteriaceae endosymbiont of Plateumaris consimilis]|uniref:signal peptide peptidase SppA n=1 Tax=Enterobacteriaceae endosymbiont of Plateumaris consimilis TaxID=2675794 RepID=UPI001449BB9F|nr:signal peptide peptidase SppA [Enterobacteriaceae endosymbiont of Plateumaris consimilis]QJC28507.1 signal peptide peptidase SppA [Enterobacteriaceae endosymbiont of Plateumaris consimilis]
MTILWNLIKYFFCYTWLTFNFIKKLILNIIFLLLIIICSYYIYNINFHNQTNNLNKNKKHILEINIQYLTDDIVNHNNIFFRLLDKIFNLPNQNSTFQVAQAILRAKTDKNISGIILNLNNCMVEDITILDYIGKYLNNFKTSGKPIYAIGDMYNQNQYYLASFADTIILEPQGYIDLHGLSTDNFYFKSFLKKIRVKLNIFKIGEFKSAIEPMTRDNMSSSTKIVEKNLINNLWGNYVKTVINNRNITFQNLFPNHKNYIQKIKDSKGNLAIYALKNKLIDKISTRFDFENDMIKKFGWDSKNQTYNHVNINEYISQNIKQDNKNNIAVISIDGILTYGIESTDIVNQINQVYLDPNIKGLILKINSPGGSLIAAEYIYNALISLKKVHKPIVVSMGELAASGGYFIATAGNYIISNKNTITGSIGIFSVIPTFNNTLKSLGIYNDGVSINTGLIDSLYKEFPLESKELAKELIQGGYEKFIHVIANGRHKSIKDVKKLANGMVWIGKDAKKNGLVDAIGDFDSAIRKISELTKIKNISLEWLESDTDLFSFKLLDFFSLKTNNSIVLKNIFPFLKNYYIQKFLLKNNSSLIMQQINDPNNIYAIYNLNIH